MTRYMIIKEVPVAGGYVMQDEGNDTGLFMLGMFLDTEITSVMAYEYFTSWLKGEMDQDSAYGHVYALVKENGKIAVINQYPVEGYHLTFITTKNEMLEMIDDWLRTILRKPRPLEVVIMQDEAGKVSFKWLGKGEELEEAAQ